MKKGFDAVAWMRSRREKIDEEDQDLSWSEKREKTHRLLQGDPLWLRLRGRAVEPAVSQRMAAREPPTEYRSTPPQ